MSIHFNLPAPVWTRTPDILINIFAYLSPKDHENIFLVNKRWNQLSPYGFFSKVRDYLTKNTPLVNTDTRRYFSYLNPNFLYLAKRIMKKQGFATSETRDRVENLLRNENYQELGVFLLRCFSYTPTQLQSMVKGSSTDLGLAFQSLDEETAKEPQNTEIDWAKVNQAISTLFNKTHLARYVAEYPKKKLKHEDGYIVKVKSCLACFPEEQYKTYPVLALTKALFARMKNLGKDGVYTPLVGLLNLSQSRFAAKIAKRYTFVWPHLNAALQADFKVVRAYVKSFNNRWKDVPQSVKVNPLFHLSVRSPNLAAITSTNIPRALTSSVQLARHYTKLKSCFAASFHVSVIKDPIVAQQVALGATDSDIQENSKWIAEAAETLQLKQLLPHIPDDQKMVLTYKRLIHFMNEKTRSDKVLMLQVLKEYPEGLEHLSSSLRQDPDIVRTAIRANFGLFRFAHPDLLKNVEHLRSAISDYTQRPKLMLRELPSNQHLEALSTNEKLIELLAANNFPIEDVFPTDSLSTDCLLRLVQLRPRIYATDSDLRIRSTKNSSLKECTHYLLQNSPSLAFKALSAGIDQKLILGQICFRIFCSNRFQYSPNVQSEVNTALDCLSKYSLVQGNIMAHIYLNEIPASSYSIPDLREEDIHVVINALDVLRWYEASSLVRECANPDKPKHPLDYRSRPVNEVIYYPPAQYLLAFNTLSAGPPCSFSFRILFDALQQGAQGAGHYLVNALLTRLSTPEEISIMLQSLTASDLLNVSTYLAHVSPALLVQGYDVQPILTIIQELQASVSGTSESSNLEVLQKSETSLFVAAPNPPVKVGVTHKEQAPSKRKRPRS